MVPRLVRPEAARPDVPAGLRREHLKAPARPSAAAARKARALQAPEEAEAMVAQRLAQAERPALQAAVVAAVQEAQQALGVVAAQPQVAPEVSDVVAAPLPAAESAGVARRLEVAAVQDVAAAVQRRAAGPASGAARLLGAEVLDAAVLRPGARDEGVRLLAAAWAGLPSTRLQGGRLAPSARARSAHARGCLRTAQP
jgi:hypothetical protein